MDLVIPDKTHDESRQGEALILEQKIGKNNGRKLYIESYGCAMNFSDSEIVASILSDEGFETTDDYNAADVIFINTCSIRTYQFNNTWCKLESGSRRWREKRCHNK